MQPHALIETRSRSGSGAGSVGSSWDLLVRFSVGHGFGSISYMLLHYTLGVEKRLKSCNNHLGQMKHPLTFLLIVTKTHLTTSITFKTLVNVDIPNAALVRHLCLTMGHIIFFTVWKCYPKWALKVELGSS